MVDRPKFTPEEAQSMGYDPEVVEFFKKEDPDLLDFMWGNGSAHYTAILKNEIPNSDLIRTAEIQIALENRIGNVAASSIRMAEFRLTHTQKPEDRG